MARVFFSYSHADEALRDQLETQLAMLRRQGVIETWHDRRIGAGVDFSISIDEHIETDEIILLLVSPNFLASDYCYEIEMRRALERHEAGEAVVIPVILRACEWQHAPFGRLNATPRDGKPVVQWPDIDEAFLQVARAVREAASRLPSKQADSNIATVRTVEAEKVGPRSSNLRLRKRFTQRDKDQFQQDTFEYMARYFANSLKELSDRDTAVEGVLRRVDANRFFASIYRDGTDVARATVFMGGNAFAGGINFVYGHATDSSSLNEWLTVESDDQSLYFSASGMAHLGGSQDKKLSQEGAAEFFWSLLIYRLQ